MSEIDRSIQGFLQRNNLLQTLKQFKIESKRSNANMSSPAYKSQFSQLVQLHKCSIPSDKETEHKMREHLQKADPRHLRKWIERMRKAKQNVEQVTPHPLTNLPFFKKLMQKQTALYEQSKENEINAMNAITLDQSRVCQNEWEEDNDIGYEAYEFNDNDFPKVLQELHQLKNYPQTAVKHVPYPQQYYLRWQTLKSTIHPNNYDNLPSLLPANAHFPQHTQQSVYPLQSEGIPYDSFDLKIIYDREKTGFEDEKNVKIVINEVLAGKYQIVSVLGQAQFSQAVEVKDLTTQKRYCLKIIKNPPNEQDMPQKEYMDQSLDEIKLLLYIKANCNPDQCSLLKIQDYFYHREHLMLLTELLKDNLYDVYRCEPEFFSLRTVQLIAKQVMTAVAKLHELHIIHCDLKPENILLKSKSNRSVKVIDVGSSIFFHDQPQFYVQTRSYRAPQIILGCPYDEKIDIWSIGCILYQIFTGKVLFESQNMIGMLAKMQGLRGPWPSYMLQIGKDVERYFTKQMILVEEILEEGRNRVKTGIHRIYTPKMTSLKSRLKDCNKAFIDFLGKCLKLDPSVRISAKQALSHPFLTETVSQ